MKEYFGFTATKFLKIGEGSGEVGGVLLLVFIKDG